MTLWFYMDFAFATEPAGASSLAGGASVFDPHCPSPLFPL